MSVSEQIDYQAKIRRYMVAYEQGYKLNYPKFVIEECTKQLRIKLRNIQIEDEDDFYDVFYK